MDPREEARIQLLLDDEIGGSDDSDSDFVEELDHNSDSEQSEEGEDAAQDEEPDGEPDRATPEPVEELEGNTNDLYKAKNGTCWRMAPQQNLRARRRRCDLLRYLPGVKGEAKNARTPIEALQLFFDNEMLESFVVSTNIYIQSIRHKYSRPRDASDTNVVELKACLGLLFLGGLMKVSHTCLEDLWNPDGTGIEYFRLTMGINRFKFLLQCLRFDDIRTRANRKLTDKLAAVRYLIERFNGSLSKHYSVSETVTIDEMLDAFRGRCGFRQYIPSKPAKYGLKIFASSDAKMYYTNKVEVYCGNQPNGPYRCSNKAQDIVKRLVQPITNSGRNVTCDNWFVSLPLATDLLENDNLTLVGTIRKNRKGIPEFMKVVKDRPIDSSIFAFRKNVTLVSYKPKKNKIVLALSTLHHEEAGIEQVGDANKPSLITFYNGTKSGVDKVDEMKCAYSTARITRRWTLVVFFSFLNIAGINAFVIYRANTEYKKERKDFLKTLAKELLHDWLRNRVLMTNIPKSIRLRLSEMLGVPLPQPQQERQVGRQNGRCSFCDRKKNRPTRFSCKGCSKYVCMEHMANYVCAECDPRMQLQEEEMEQDDE